MSLVLLPFLLVSSNAFANLATESLVWSDQQGFQSSAQCELKKTSQIGFQVSHGKDGHVLRKASQGAEELSEYVIELKDGTPKALLNSELNLVGSFWQVAMEQDQYLSLRCGEKNYVLFDVFVRESSEAVARVAVNEEESAIFRSIELHTPKQAEQKIEGKEVSAESHAHGSQSVNVFSNRPVDLRKSVSVGGGVVKNASTTLGQVNAPTHSENSTQANGGTAMNSIVAKANTVTAPASPVAAPVVVQSSLEHVVCIKDGSLQVRDEKLSGVLFNAIKLEVVKPMQTFGTEKQTRVVNGKTYSEKDICD